jgi:hypothetical protein
MGKYLIDRVGKVYAVGQENIESRIKQLLAQKIEL